MFVNDTQCSDLSMETRMIKMCYTWINIWINIPGAAAGVSDTAKTREWKIWENPNGGLGLQWTTNTNLELRKA
jgi:hypothetical protein